LVFAPLFFNLPAKNRVNMALAGVFIACGAIEYIVKIF
jgi:hypothetical protein